MKSWVGVLLFYKLVCFAQNKTGILGTVLDAKRSGL
jgi:hypothetical protein